MPQYPWSRPGLIEILWADQVPDSEERRTVENLVRRYERLAVAGGYRIAVVSVCCDPIERDPEAVSVVADGVARVLRIAITPAWRQLSPDTRAYCLVEQLVSAQMSVPLQHATEMVTRILTTAGGVEPRHQRWWGRYQDVLMRWLMQGFDADLSSQREQGEDRVIDPAILTQ